MIALLIQFIIMCLILGVLYYVAKLLVGFFELPGIILQILAVVIAVIFIIWLLQALLMIAGSGPVVWPKLTR